MPALDLHFFSGIGCPPVTEGRTSSIWLDVCLRANAPCDKPQDWTLPLVSLGTDCTPVGLPCLGTPAALPEGSVCLRPLEAIGPIEKVLCVNIDATLGDRKASVPLDFSQCGPTYIPEPATTSMLAAGLVLVALLPRRLRRRRVRAPSRA